MDCVCYLHVINKCQAFSGNLYVTFNWMALQQCFWPPVLAYSNVANYNSVGDWNQWELFLLTRLAIARSEVASMCFTFIHHVWA